MRKVLAIVVLIAAAFSACGLFGKPAETPPSSAVEDASPAPTPPAPASTGAHKLGIIFDGGFFPGNGRLFYTAGVADTITVPAGAYVTSIECHSTSGGTLTITPNGPGVTDAQAGPAIILPAGVGYSKSRPVLTGNQNEIGPGSVIAFSGTDAYTVWFWEY